MRRFAVVCAMFVGIKLLFQLYQGDFPGKDQALAFSWPLVLGALGFGAAGLLADRSLGLPDRTDRRALFSAVIAGLAYGGITVFTDVYRGGEVSPVAMGRGRRWRWSGRSICPMSSRAGCFSASGG